MISTTAIHIIRKFLKRFQSHIIINMLNKYSIIQFSSTEKEKKRSKIHNLPVPNICKEAKKVTTIITFT
ncbi:hypothetical protein DICPUDRAFT_151281 [Dictyostelium purpureum]|uniref:Uncharacterized protein n=1 Tax=Dictyostelium purpureum TaxID=5786 RepID=F0ZIG3_DICPU|nr:uncharacterized protein DICPUDRAFT_151281 [Dictyostelium purpureum]EGC36254.1 hypothetical protein DICPUDRAFT_151281 [Dictyostelium purpureum]|eukprot:XP_003287200.1 hypothetical protein DICPUDRAFT_151281 [Dictyostelium purpureum]